jgi:hypothetical protein
MYSYLLVCIATGEPGSARSPHRLHFQVMPLNDDDDDDDESLHVSKIIVKLYSRVHSMFVISDETK